MPVRAITSTEDFTATIGSDKLVLVDFYADWCGPCRVFAPTLVNISEEFVEKIDVAKINVDDLGEVAMDQKIEALPTFVFYKNGKQLGKVEGAVEDAVRGAIAKLVQ